jgi:hypothetical protein
MELKDTVERMLSDDPKERLIAEYQQVGIRIEELRKLTFDYAKGLLSFEPASYQFVYENQLSAMRAYQDCLTQRIKDEKIPGFGCFGDTCSI